MYNCSLKTTPYWFIKIINSLVKYRLISPRFMSLRNWEECLQWLPQFFFQYLFVHHVQGNNININFGDTKTRRPSIFFFEHMATFWELKRRWLGGGFKYFLFPPLLGKIPILTNIFQRGWNHQLDDADVFFSLAMGSSVKRASRCLGALLTHIRAFWVVAGWVEIGCLCN